FLLTLGGPIIGRRALAAVRGVAINQHAGWSPDLRGSGTIERALFHRRLDWVGSTVHVMSTAVDAGPILRRAHATLHADCTPAECFLRVVSLGTELMLEVVDEAIAADSL